MIKINRYTSCILFVLGLFVFGEGVMWGNSSYYAILKGKSEPTGIGTVYVKANEDDNEYTDTAYDNDDNAGGTVHMYVKAVINNEKYHFKEWGYEGNEITFDHKDSLETECQMNVSSSTGQSNAKSYTAVANFENNFFTKAKIGGSTPEGCTAYVARGSSFSGKKTEVLGSDNGQTATGVAETFTVNATCEDDKYVWNGWTFTNASIKSSENQPQTFTVTTAASYDEDDPFTITCVATPSFLGKYYAKLSFPISTTGTSGQASVSSSSENPNYTTEGAGKSISFNIQAPSASEGYHFSQWKCDQKVSFASVTSPSTSVTVSASSSVGSANVTEYTIEPVYEQNKYYANLTAQTGSGCNTASVTSSPLYTETSGGEVTFQINTTAADGYHFKNWTIISGSGTFGDENSTNTTFTVKAATEYGEDKAISCTVQANYETDQYAARVILNNSSYKYDDNYQPSKAGYLRVGTSKNSWNNVKSDDTTMVSNNSGQSINVYIKAFANTGYRFAGWYSNDNSIQKVDSISTNNPLEITVNTSETQGETANYNYYAVFKRGYYYVTYNPNGGTGKWVRKSGTSGKAYTVLAHTKLKFQKDFTVTYDASEGTCKTESETKDRFVCWTDSLSNKTFDDNYKLDTMIANMSYIKLLATWASTVDFTLPTPTKTSEDGAQYACLGWYDADGNKIGDAADTVGIGASQTLYARWQTYDITINANSTDYTEGDRAVFSLKRSGTPASEFKISIPIGGSKTIKNVTPGKWTVTPLPEWSWNYTVSDESLEKTLVDDGNTAFDFTFTTKNSGTKHSESAYIKPGSE